MSPHILLILLMSLYCNQLSGLNPILKKIYRRFGPMMCLHLCRHSAKFSGVVTQFNCHRNLQNGLRSTTRLSNEDTFFCLGNQNRSKENTSLTVKSGEEKCVTNSSGEIQSYLQLHQATKKEGGQYNDVLHWACKEGKLCIVEYILSQRLADINCRGQKGRTPVMEAVKHGNAAVFDFLVTQGCDLTLTDNYKNTLLHLASWGGSLDVVKNLTESGKYDINRRGQMGYTPVLVAVCLGHTEVFDYFKTKGCDLKKTANHRNNIIHVAALGGHSELLKHILSLNIVDINSRGQFQFTPVMVASDMGHKAAVEVLARRGCSLTKVDIDGNNVLHLASIKGHSDVVEYILMHRIPNTDSRGKYGYTPVMMATKQGHRGVVEVLVSKGCDVTVIDSDKNNILHVACSKGHIDIVNYLLSYSKISIESKGQRGQTPVMAAAETGQKEVFELLVKRRCDLKAVDKSGGSILHVASFGGHVRMVNYIVTKRLADIEGRDFKMRTPVMTAALFDSLGVVKLLVSRGCNLQSVDKGGYSALHLACLSRKVRIVKYLLQQKHVIKDGKNKRGMTPMQLASLFGYSNIVSLFKQ